MRSNMTAVECSSHLLYTENWQKITFVLLMQNLSCFMLSIFIVSNEWLSINEVYISQKKDITFISKQFCTLKTVGLQMQKLSTWCLLQGSRKLLSTRSPFYHVRPHISLKKPIIQSTWTWSNGWCWNPLYSHRTTTNKSIKVEQTKLTTWATIGVGPNNFLNVLPNQYFKIELYVIFFRNRKLYMLLHQISKTKM